MAAEGVSRMALAEFVLALPILGKASLVSIGPHTSEAVSYTHLTLPTSDLV